MTDRHAFRANWHDYNDGVFFVTICCKNRHPYFGEIVNGAMTLSFIGKETETAILAIPNHHSNVEINNYVIMPNHVHLVMFVGARYIAPLQIWQRSFHEHIIREQRSYDQIMEYIDNNVVNWQKDCFYSNN